MKVKLKVENGVIIALHRGEFISGHLLWSVCVRPELKT